MAKVEIRAGELDTRITFQRATIAKDTAGQTIKTWADATTVWAAMKTTGGGEFYAAQKKNAETTALFKVRYNATINDRMRIKLGSRIFEILPPINDVGNRHIVMLVSAREVV